MTPRVAIVGSGLGGFVAYATLRHGGLEPAEIAVFGDEPDPAGAWRPARPRSGSAGCARRATATATRPRSRGSPRGRRRAAATSSRCCSAVCNRYRPTVAEFLRHVDELRERSRWDESFRAARIERVRRSTAASSSTGTAASGTSCSRPAIPASPSPELAADPRVVHAYEPHEYASRVAVVGAGMAAATEWLNALAAGAEVVSVRRREPARRPLNVARPLFTKRGLAGFRATRGGERARCCAASASLRTRPGAPGTSRSSARRARAASASSRS